MIYKADRGEIYGTGGPVLIDYAAPCPECSGGLEVRSEAVRQRANIPASYCDATLRQFDWEYQENGKPANMEGKRKVVDSFIADFTEWEKDGMGLYIHSRTRGSGKTFLASCICNELMKSGAMVTKFVRAGDLIDIAKSADPTSPNLYEREPVRLLQACKLLVLDDIGQKQSGAAWHEDILFQIIDQRVNDGLVTIYTSNVRLDQLEIDDRIVSRIYQKSVELRLPEYSHRTKAANLHKVAFLKERGVIA